MNVLIIGANGKVGKHIIKHLNIEGHQVRAMIRNKQQVEKIAKLGAEPILKDLEEDFSEAFVDVDAVVFTAGSGSSTGPEKTIEIDQNAAIKSMDLAKKLGVQLYVMVSAQGSRTPDAPSKIQHYFKAKHKADEHLKSCGLPYIIFRPGRLTDEEANYKSLIGLQLDTKGTTSRENLAYAIAKAIKIPSCLNKTIEILDGQKEITNGLKSL